MKPRTKIQKKIIELKSLIPKATEEQQKHALKNTHSKFVVVAYTKKHYCLECGHIWDADTKATKKAKGCTCPSCENKLKLTHYQGKHRTHSTAYYSIVTTVKKYQVVRMFFTKKILEKGKKPNHEFTEVIQHWIDEKGVINTISKPTQAFGFYFDNWAYGDLEFRTKSYRQEQIVRLRPSVVFPKTKILPIIKRNGFKTSFHGIAPQKLLSGLLNNSVAESFFKLKQYGLVKEIVNERYNTKYQQSINIAVRHNYLIKDVSDYTDYIGLLEFFNKDILNPKYICPHNFKQAHDKLVEKRANITTDEELELISKRLQPTYQQAKKMFFGLKIKGKDIVIQPLKSIEEFYKEATELKHCIYANKYYQKENSLLLSAKINGKRTETIEISLKTFEIVQSRGKCNTPSKHNGKIVNLVNKNINQIKKIAFKQAS